MEKSAFFNYNIFFWVWDKVWALINTMICENDTRRLKFETYLFRRISAHPYMACLKKNEVNLPISQHSFLSLNIIRMITPYKCTCLFVKNSNIFILITGTASQAIANV